MRVKTIRQESRALLPWHLRSRAKRAADRKLHVRALVARLASIILACFTVGVMAETNFSWPSLDGVPHIKERAATVHDIDAGTAVFALKNDDTYVGMPVDIEIPQYAFHIDPETNARKAVIVVQAEDNGEVTAIGFLDAADLSKGVGLIGEFEFLGTAPAD